MKPFLFILINFIVTNKIYSQNIVEIKIEVGAKRKITKVDVEATDTAMQKRIKERLNNFVFSKPRPKKGMYLARVAYIVTKDSNVADVKCLSDPGYGICNEAVRVIHKSVPWKPAPQGGCVVRPYRR